MKLSCYFYAVLSSALPLIISSANAADYTEYDDDLLDSFYGSEEMVEIATGVKTQIYKAPAVTNVFTAEKIKNMGATDIDDVLETVPGLHIHRDPNGYLPLYTFRGIYSSVNSQALMLINGVPITNSFRGNRGQVWGRMPVEAISRIEIMRGPGSAVFGADAFAGVINIITKNADDILQNEVAVRAGSFNTQNMWLTFGGSSEELKYSTVIEYSKSSGSNEHVEIDRQTANDIVHGTNASRAPGNVSKRHESLDIRTEINYFDFTFRAGLQDRNNQGGGAGLVSALDPDIRQASKRWNIDLNYNAQLTPNFKITTQATYFNTSQEVKNQYTIFPAGYAGVFTEGLIGNPQVWEKHTRLNINAQYTAIKDHSIRGGFGYHNADMYRIEETKNFGIDPSTGLPIAPGSPLVDVTDTPYVFIPEQSRQNHYVFLQDIWNIANDWQLTAGLRHDNYSDFGSTTNPRVALVWSTSLNLSTKLLYGQAFRAPSFVDTSAINNPVNIGNPNIQPEEMESLEIVFDYHPAQDFGLVWNIYKYTWDDIIQLVPVQDESYFLYANNGVQTAYGTEFEINWKLLPTLVLRANAAFTQAENSKTKNDVPFVAAKQFYVQLDWLFADEINVNFKTHLIGERLRDETDSRNALKDYAISDLSVRWQPKNLPVELSLLGKNIFNKDARGSALHLPNDLPLPLRSIYGELRYQF
ncbi:TonB-dependent receptor plug domain-containing protein [Algibacillus agarilyticus]|uniref:TonB-dependent receptor plug domain-containing protein n=1 Tax=Algibacillus agarilyticus TaxID=2234133 RepID=UPI000DCFDA37|nr:TonB-dependent receptor [Algibacillus agarilyticus]